MGKQTIHPEGGSSVSPYLMVDSVEKELEFLHVVFDAVVTERTPGPDGKLMHGEARIGGSLLMMGRSRPQYPARRGMNYVYVADVDAAYQRALDQGAVSLQIPTSQPYGNRECGVTDPQGNDWWIATME